MTYCITNGCPNPKNDNAAQFCQSCGSKLWIRDRYRVLGALGRGGFGATFLARDQLLPGCPPCVIKQLRPTTDVPNLLDMARDLFQREAKILGKIGNHPQLPRLLDYFEMDKEFYLVQEYVSGSTLQKEVKRFGPFTEVSVKQFLNEILPVIQYIHSHQIIHRDIKPANLIRREQDQQLVMIDFGAVKDKVNQPTVDPTDQTTLTAYAIGTPGYAPPEQMAMRPVYASDLYAIGVTCIYLLTGVSPKDLPYNAQTGELRWQERVSVSSHFSQVLVKMLDISVHNRYQMAEEIMRDLDIEPHLDSLAQSLSFATAGQATIGQQNTQSAERTSGKTSGRISPSARMAAAIRARKERRVNSGANYKGVERRRNRKHTAQSLKDAYAKGQRDFSDHILTQLDLHKQTFAEARFAKANLREANLTGADLSQTHLGQANLTRASLKNAKLAGAHLVYANLEGADLRGANLNRANLGSAKLDGANLCGADLTGATLSEAQLDTALTNWATIHVNGRRSLL
ncbi:serine/threonine-protein kinase [cf. Phormidesmis sp. LEGE 11477]|uniref:serine/threonine-protein kinase n=1 Tax=cf. Phormidesmis sp. LEGE 11477 TaxID=1828680 RepID=UPI00187F44DC|nr:serine/threonine-protein kinase [cf. Phormidesmis sp. LEGE 11477]MBE9062644.1 pentapeptide repeat-containing protein [cf. Phormidesmis sp. LEGE 11477]